MAAGCCSAVNITLAYDWRSLSGTRCESRLIPFIITRHKQAIPYSRPPFVCGTAADEHVQKLGGWRCTTGMQQASRTRVAVPPQPYEILKRGKHGRVCVMVLPRASFLGTLGPEVHRFGRLTHPSRGNRTTRRLDLACRSVSPAKSEISPRGRTSRAAKYRGLLDRNSCACRHVVPGAASRKACEIAC